MTFEEIKQDFESARIKQVHFKNQLRSCLFGNGGEEGPLRNLEQCRLGLWSAAHLRGNGPYAPLADAWQFNRKHTMIQQEANRLMNRYTTGQKAAISARHTPL